MRRFLLCARLSLSLSLDSAWVAAQSSHVGAAEHPWKSNAMIAASTGLRGSAVSARWEAAAGAARMEAGGEHIGAFFGGEAPVLAAETASVGGRSGGSLRELGERSRGRPGTRVAGLALHRGEEHRGGRRTIDGLATNENGAQERPRSTSVSEPASQRTGNGNATASAEVEDRTGGARESIEPRGRGRGEGARLSAPPPRSVPSFRVNSLLEAKVAFIAHLLDGDHESGFSQSAERLQRHGFSPSPGGEPRPSRRVRATGLAMNRDEARSSACSGSPRIRWSSRAASTLAASPPASAFS